ncbi:sulfatase-like hydrolase/transferase [Rhizobium binxianense]
MTRRPNILFLLSDEHSFRFMNYMSRAEGGEAVETSFFDRLAATATIFDTAYCAVPLCTPSRMCLMTGLEAPRCGATDNSGWLDPELDTLPKMLVRAGYETALVGKMHFNGSNQFHGFRHRPFGDVTGKAIHQWEHLAWPTASGAPSELNPTRAVGISDHLPDRTAKAGLSRIPESLIVDRIVAEETVSWLREYKASDAESPWFLCASFSRPHFPLTTPRRWFERYRGKVTPPFIGREGASYDHPVSRAIREGFDTDRIGPEETMNGRTGYFACVSYLDEILGDMMARLEAAGLLDDTIIVYSSDHGDMVGELGTWWKSGWYEGCTRVPLLISTPEQRRGIQPARRISTPVSLLDLAPTLAALASAAPAAEVTGLDLSAAITGDADVPPHPVFCDHLNSRWGEGTAFRAIRYDRWKYVMFEGFQSLLFDVVADPAESRNLIEQAPADLIEKLETYAVDWTWVNGPLAARQKELRSKYPLDGRGTTASQFIIPEGKVVAADTTIYRPIIVSETPETFFTDWPEGVRDREAGPPSYRD